MALVQRFRGRQAFDGVPVTPPNALTYIAGGTTTTALSFIDLTLPSIYAWFRLELSNLTCSSPALDAVCITFSSDAGATFITDPSHQDTYQNVDRAFKAVGDTTSDTNTVNLDHMGYLGGWVTGPDDESGVVSTILQIYPGTSTRLAYFWERSFTIFPAITAASNVYNVISSVALNIAATTPITPARINLIRLAPLDNPHTIVAGLSYALWGFKP